MNEAIAQVGGIALLYPEENRGLTPMFTGIDKVRFRHPVKPGDQVRMEVDIVKIKGKMGKVEGRAYVGDKLCASGDYIFAQFSIWMDYGCTMDVGFRIFHAYNYHYNHSSFYYTRANMYSPLAHNLSPT